jgi:hypothetical protein
MPCSNGCFQWRLKRFRGISTDGQNFTIRVNRRGGTRSLEAATDVHARHRHCSKYVAILRMTILLWQVLRLRGIGQTRSPRFCRHPGSCVVRRSEDISAPRLPPSAVLTSSADCSTSSKAVAAFGKVLHARLSVIFLSVNTRSVISGKWRFSNNFNVADRARRIGGVSTHTLAAVPALRAVHDCAPSSLARELVGRRGGTEREGAIPRPTTGAAANSTSAGDWGTLVPSSAECLRAHTVIW